MKPQAVEQKPFRSETTGEIKVRRRQHASNPITPPLGGAVIGQEHEFIWISVETVGVYSFH